MAKASRGHRPPAPSVAKWRLAGLLKSERTKREMTIEEACAVAHLTSPTLMRYEKGATAPGFNDLEAIIRNYEISDELAERMKGAWNDSRRRSPLERYARNKHVDSQWRRYLEFEWTAESIKNFEPLLIPGLLQIPAYSMAVINVVERHDDEKVKTLLEIRRLRQELVETRAAEGFSLDQHFIVDEAAIRRQVGGVEVMRAQLSHLIEWATDRTDGARLQVVPFERGLYAHLRVGYVLLHLLAPEEPDEPPVLYLEEALEQLVIHEDKANRGRPRSRSVDLEKSMLEVLGAEQQPSEYEQTFTNVSRDFAASPKESLTILKSAYAAMAP